MNNDFVFKVKSVNAYLRIGKYLVILLIVFCSIVWIAQVFADRSFYDLIYYYIGAILAAITLAIISFIKCKAIIYEIYINEDKVHIKWKIWEKHFQKETSINNVEAFLIPLGKQESGLRIKIKEKDEVIIIDQCRISNWGDNDIKELVSVVKERKGT